MELLPIDTYWIFRTLFYCIYGIIIFRVVNSGIREWIRKEGEVLKFPKFLKFRLALQALFLIVILVPTIFYSAVISFWFSFFNGNFLNLTIVTSIIVIPMVFWEII